jgi:NAD(P)-dependent dehydrogenase (short-subunit alcohol dehydrogenase family)
MDNTGRLSIMFESRRVRITTALSVAALALVMFAGVWSLKTTPLVEAAGAPSPQPAISSTLTDLEIADFLANAKTLSAAADNLVNVAVALKRNQVVGVPGVEYTTDQIDEINSAGLAAFYNAVQAGSRGLAIANISTGTLNNFAAANPDLVGVQPTYCSSGDVTKCPGYVTPTPTP